MRHAFQIPDHSVRSRDNLFLSKHTAWWWDDEFVAAAWDGAFRLRHHEHGSWVYTAVGDPAIDDPVVLVKLVRDRALALSTGPVARPVSKRHRLRRQPRRGHCTTSIPAATTITLTSADQ